MVPVAARQRLQSLSCNRPTLPGLRSRSDYHYPLPAQLIAQHPLPRRSDSRLLLLDRDTGAIRHDRFANIGAYLRPGDLLVCNDTKVMPARLRGRKVPTGGAVEALFERCLGVSKALFQLGFSRAPKVGSLICFERDGQRALARVLARQREFFSLEFQGRMDVEKALRLCGDTPLPPYIRRATETPDEARYQTVYARSSGSAAAPTAGLHFDLKLLDELAASGIARTFLTLHVGAGTFQPVRTENLGEHRLHAEWCRVGPETVAAIASCKAAGGRVLAVGTTSARALEAAARKAPLTPWQGEVDLFIFPPHTFCVIDGLITNFHLPESTLLMLVCALAGYDRTMAAYQIAVREGYRFFSYGDAMCILPDLAMHSPDR